MGNNKPLLPVVIALVFLLIIIVSYQLYNAKKDVIDKQIYEWDKRAPLGVKIQKANKEIVVLNKYVLNNFNSFKDFIERIAEENDVSIFSLNQLSTRKVDIFFSIEVEIVLTVPYKKMIGFLRELEVQSPVIIKEFDIVNKDDSPMLETRVVLIGLVKKES